MEPHLTGRTSGSRGKARLALGATAVAGLLGLLFIGEGADEVLIEAAIDDDPPVALLHPATAIAAAPGPAAPGPALAGPAASGPRLPRPEGRRDELEKPAAPTELRVYCCPTAFRSIVRRLERDFETRHPGVDLVALAHRDRDCVDFLLMGTADIAVISTALSAAERSQGLTDQTVAHRVVVPVVHPSNSVESVPHTSLQQLLAGTLQRWREVGGDDSLIQPICKSVPRIDDHADRCLRFRGKAADLAISYLLQEGVLADIANRPRALGLVSLTHAQGVRDVRILQISHVTPALNTFVHGSWPLGATIRAVCGPRPDPVTQSWLDYVSTEPVRKVLQREFILPPRSSE